MIRDLMGAGQVQAQADFLVIGAGTVGLVVATQLAALGKRVICMESGGQQQDADTHPLNETEQPGETLYLGADHGRFRCLGGTSTRWGGALIPFQAADLEGANWPISWAELAPHLPAVEALFGLPPGLYEDSSIPIGRDYIARLAKWPTFKKRNVFTLLQSKVEAEDGPEVWVHATATAFVVEGGTLKRVTANSGEGDALTVTASEVVICAGAIESTRLLLLIQQQNPGALTGAKLGEGLHDHLSAVVGEIEVRDRKALNQLVGFRFSPGGGMRNLRFELAPDSPLRRDIPPCFAHIGFSETEGGFSALRDIYRSLQKRQLPSLKTWLGLTKGSVWLIKAAYWRFVYRRLLIPDGARVQVHLVIEQKSNAKNRISLSTRTQDLSQMPLARLEWAVSPEDVERMKKATRSFCDSWERSELAGLGSIRKIGVEDIAAQLAAGGGIYHPGGSTRVAIEESGGVVNTGLQVFGLSNLGILATSLLPTGGGANPTMMLFLLAARYVHARMQT